MHVLIIGGGICGLGTALLLARVGHDVTLLERDGAPTPVSPADAWEGWQRRGVAQFRQPHNFMPGLRLLLEEALPDVQQALADEGASRFDMLNPLPPSITDRSPRAIDTSLWTYTARRPVGEWVFARAAEREARVAVRRGVAVTALVPGPPVSAGIPHIVGVRTSAGEELRGDLVVDARGRQSRNGEWLTTLGARRPFEEQADCGFIYYTRYFTGKMPERRGPGLTPIGSISVLTLMGDNDTWSVTIFTSVGDQALKNLRHEKQWTKVAQACPMQAHWLEGEPITGVLAMSGIVDRYRHYVVDGLPVVTGFVAVADAWACSNPSAGRGLTVGFKHARLLRDVIAGTADNPRTLVEEFYRRTEAQIAPWHHAQIASDRMRFAEIEAIREGRVPPPPQTALAASIQSLMMSMADSPDLFRAGLEYLGTITPVQDILKRPGVAEEIQHVLATMKDLPPRPVPGPSRQELLQLVQ
ncbi:MAG: FAD-dependent oxidoreductase [Acidobacteria bacterium]|nr:MAG: FAD-dependent oxidoreductase [Acidobacteriota bacterium]